MPESYGEDALSTTGPVGAEILFKDAGWSSRVATGGRYRRGRSLLTLLLGVVLATAVHADGPVHLSPLRHNASPTTPSGHTYVAATSSLDFAKSRPPQTLDELRMLEKQLLAVVEKTRECTVSIRIGNAQGSGVIISEDGYVLTAAHVAMRPGLTAYMKTSDGRELVGKTLGMNRHVDAGLIKLQSAPTDLHFASLGSSKTLRPGMWCLAVGHPGGYERERGSVVRIGRILETRDDSLITDCTLISGDSGGPLFDLTGRLIAVHSRIGNDVADNIHIPVDNYDQSWDRMATGEAWGHLPGFKPVVGVGGKKGSERAEIDRVNPNSPADRAGLKVGDIVTRFGDIEISTFEDLSRAVQDTMPGEHVSLRVERDGEVLRLVLVIGRDPRE